MRWRNVIISCMLACGSLWLYALGAEISQEAVGKAVEIVRYGRDYSTAHLEAVRMDGRKGIAVLFEGTEGMHYYARPDTAPAKNLALKVTAEADGFKFGEPVFERWKIFDDPTGQRVEVYAGDFAVFVPIEAVEGDRAESDITVRISGIACTSMICLAPFEKTLQTTVNLNSSDTWRQISFKAAAEQVTAHEQSLR